MATRAIIARKPATDGKGSIVLAALWTGRNTSEVHFADKLATADEFATWWEDDAGETFNGHYTCDLTAAVTEYNERGR